MGGEGRVGVGCRVWRGGGGMRVVGSGVDGVEVESGGVEFSF